PVLSLSSMLLSIRRPPVAPLFPYTTLFRSPRLAAPPARVAHGLAVLQRKAAQGLVAHGVMDDAMAIRAQAGDDGVVVGKGERRVGRLHPFGAHAFGGEAVQVRRIAAPEEVGVYTVQGHQQQRRTVGSGLWRHARARAQEQQEG